jgi:hypothetical protein
MQQSKPEEHKNQQTLSWSICDLWTSPRSLWKLKTAAPDPNGFAVMKRMIRSFCR